jgi:serine/threonine protein kinase
LTTATVFDAQNVLDLYEKHLTESPIKPSQRTANPMSAELEETILRCLEKEPNLRPQSVGELRALLLTSPRASDWGLEARAAWWAKYQDQEIQRPGEGEQRASSPIDATVKVDFASRIQS